jgi:hypothetical protein
MGFTRKLYYYPLSSYLDSTMTPADTEDQPSQEGVTAMAVDQIGAAPPHQPSGAK